MKKFPLLLLVFLLTLGSCSTDGMNDEKESPSPLPPEAERTVIADSNFETALVELNLDDEVDGSVLTSRIRIVTDLIIEDKGIQNLSGIADFTALVNLNVRGNQLSQLNLASNTQLLFVWAENNALTQITIGNDAIEKIGLSGNQITQIDVSAYDRLQLLTLADNDVNRINVSGSPDLNTFSAEGNPLSCIQVSQEQLDAIPALWTKDAEDQYSLNCDI
ncbi:hypothetical protein ACT6NV_01790 [Robiginitalea sp. IMCC44478]|uniref:hypothetical protein n=1 Tax=Robiginitalea sp. IMCC44478 TaxID=3459122 RepID=UPI00404383FA